MHLSQKLQYFAEEARLGLDDIAAEARARGGQTSPDRARPRRPRIKAHPTDEMGLRRRCTVP